MGRRVRENRGWGFSALAIFWARFAYATEPEQLEILLEVVVLLYFLLSAIKNVIAT
jgi:hypothetical protein